MDEFKSPLTNPLVCKSTFAQAKRLSIDWRFSLSSLMFRSPLVPLKDHPFFLLGVTFAEAVIFEVSVPESEMSAFSSNELACPNDLKFITELIFDNCVVLLSELLTLTRPLLMVTSIFFMGRPIGSELMLAEDFSDDDLSDSVCSFSVGAESSMTGSSITVLLSDIAPVSNEAYLGFVVSCFIAT
ncbi:MAG TPA: hypothetical protein PLP05_10815, partial [Sedimentisphaerales bacterium]|nr:hypothetical protein [Sedimentisphaerales bacterium]